MAKTFGVSSAEVLVGREAELSQAAAAVRELSAGRFAPSLRIVLDHAAFGEGSG